MMKTSFSKFYSLLLLVSFFSFHPDAIGQILKPVKWSASFEHKGGDEYDLLFTANIKEGWYVYSQYLDSDDGPVATTVGFLDESLLKLKGKSTEEGSKVSGFDAIFEMNVVKFKKNFTIRQRVAVKDLSKPIKGYVNYMTCDDQQCLPPIDFDFELKLSKESGGMGAISPNDGGIQLAGGAQIPEGDTDDFFQDDDDQFLAPASWTGSVTLVRPGIYELVFEVDLDEGWHIYSQYLDGDDGPIPTAFIINEAGIDISEFSEEGKKRIEEYDEFFEMNLIKLKGKTIFKALVKAEGIRMLTGFIDFQACDAARCLPPIPLTFEIDLELLQVEIEPHGVPQLGAGKTKGEGTPAFADFDYSSANSTCEDAADREDDEDKSSWFWIFLLGFGGGLLAILTPCVFPMIPLTVSFFTKSSKNRASGIRNAILYGLSIIVIYLILGLLITGIFGADALNLLSTNAWFNIFFAILFIVFAISFFGYFEITLPASWINKTDQASDKGGLLGIFFMAFTLSLVSFSCTGPIIGTLLVETATGGGEVILGRIPVAPLVGMFGFALALALPFGLFAAFPGWLNSLPRSGNWMNSIKVTLGFVEIALALKFLSIADLTMGWKIMPYELFVFLWILCAVGLAAYYFGWIKFPHDSPAKEVSNMRRSLGVMMLIFSIYLSFGFRYSEKAGTFATPNLLSGLAPPAGHSYIYPNTCPLNLSCFKDYYEGIEAAKKLNKPVLVDFTGHGCVNCRRMEDQVWSQEGIYELLRDEYILVSLYVDERKELAEPYISTFDGKEKKTVGNRWSDFQAIHFNRNSQPYYVLVSPDGIILNRPVAYTPDADEYRGFLECGLERFKQIAK